MRLSDLVERLDVAERLLGDGRLYGLMRLEQLAPGVRHYAAIPRSGVSEADRASRVLDAGGQIPALEAALTKLDRHDLLVLTDLSYVRKDQAETSALFELISK